MISRSDYEISNERDDDAGWLLAGCWLVLGVVIVLLKYMLHDHVLFVST
jgi:hypothetical protein